MCLTCEMRESYLLFWQWQYMLNIFLGLLNQVHECSFHTTEHWTSSELWRMPVSTLLQSKVTFTELEPKCGVLLFNFNTPNTFGNPNSLSLQLFSSSSWSVLRENHLWKEMSTKTAWVLRFYFLNSIIGRPTSGCAFLIGKRGGGKQCQEGR